MPETPIDPSENTSPGLAPSRSDHDDATGPVALEPDELVGRTILDRYKILQRIGEGGMGAVYLALHTIIEKKVVLKVLHGEYGRKPDLVERFLHEAKTASKIRHENVVDITDFGQIPGGTVFIAMEYLKGRDLADRIKDEGPLRWELVKPIALQICSALEEAHNCGVVHRDLKPENIFVLKRGGREDFVKVLDFGIAKMTEVEETGKKLTRTGMVFGTPEYMAPEQARGERTDRRVDVYAMGCILYEMLCGDVPFRANSFMGVLTKHIFDPVIAPSVRFPELGVPPLVEAVILRALDKDKDKRYQSMAELATALESCEGASGTAGMPSFPQQPLGLPQAMAPNQGRIATASPAAVAALGTAATMTHDAVEALDEWQPPRRMSTGLILGITAVVLGLGGIGAYFIFRPKPKADKPAVVADKGANPTSAGGPDVPGGKGTLPVVATASDAGAAAVKDPTPQVPAGPVKHKILIETDPAGASIKQGMRELAKTPFTFEIEDSKAPVKYVLALKGFKDAPLEVVPDSDGKYVVPLVKLSSGGGHGGHKGGGEPGNKDLKNPFGN